MRQPYLPFCVAISSSLGRRCDARRPIKYAEMLADFVGGVAGDLRRAVPAAR